MDALRLSTFRPALRLLDGSAALSFSTIGSQGMIAVSWRHNNENQKIAIICFDDGGIFTLITAVLVGEAKFAVDWPDSTMGSGQGGPPNEQTTCYFTTKCPVGCVRTPHEKTAPCHLFAGVAPATLQPV